MTGGSSLGIGVTMFLRDQFSGPAASIRSSAEATQQQLLRMQEQQLRQQRNMYAGMAFAGGMALRRMGQVVNSAAKFGFEMEFVKQISKSSGDELNTLSNQAMQLGQSTIFFAKDVAEGMRFMAMAGMKYKDIHGNIAAAVDLAAAANLQIAGRGGAADILTNIMIAFQKEAIESGHVADMLAHAATSANLNVFELGEAIKYSASTARTLNISLEESIAVIQTLADAGIQGSMAGVAFENSMRYLAQSIGDFAGGTKNKALDKLGLTGSDFQDAQGNMNSMVQNISTLKKAMIGVGTTERYNIAKVLFGVRGARAGLLLMDNFERFTGHLEAMGAAGGTAGRISAGMMDTLEGSLRRLRAVWQHMGIIFTEGIQPVLRPTLTILETIINVMQKIFKIPVFGNMLSVGLAGFIAIKTVAFAFKAVLKGIQLVTLQNQTAMGMFSTKTVLGFKSMTAAAREYNAAVMRANMAGGMSSMAGVRTMIAAGGVKGLTLNKAGRIVAQSKTGMRTFVSGAAAQSVAKGAARVVGGRVVANSATRMILGRILGILGGPFGLAISFALPAAIGGLSAILKKQKDATEKNSEALRKQAEKVKLQSQGQAIGHIIKFQDINAEPLKVIGQTGRNQLNNQWSQNQLQRLNDNLEKLMANPQAQPIIINVDGEEAQRINAERTAKDTLQILSHL